MHLQSMHEILVALRGFTGLFDLAIGNMSDVSRDIVKSVKFRILTLDSYSRVSGHLKYRGNSSPDSSTAK